MLNPSGCQIVCAETVAVPHWFIDQPDNTEHPVHSGEWYLFKNREHRHKLVYFIRWDSHIVELIEAEKKQSENFHFFFHTFMKIPAIRKYWVDVDLTAGCLHVIVDQMLLPVFVVCKITGDNFQHMSFLNPYSLYFNSYIFLTIIPVSYLNILIVIILQTYSNAYHYNV